MLVGEQRLAVLAKFGGKCVKCGFDDPRALQIDHINGGGGQANKYMSLPWQLVVSPEKFQILCANCNWIKRYENNEVRAKYAQEGNVFRALPPVRAKIIAALRIEPQLLSTLVHSFLDSETSTRTIYRVVKLLQKDGIVELTRVAGQYNKKLVSIVPSV